jgi:alkylation response protein AidB-like acyl-CoA dehydrogenase
MTALDLNDDLPEQREIREQAHRFGAEVLRPASLALDGRSAEEVIAEGSQLWEVFRQAYRVGYHLRPFPSELGGPDHGPADAWVVSEEFGWGSAGLASGLEVTAVPFHAASLTGNPDLMREVVMPFVEDTEGKYIGCWCATEPQHGSDLMLCTGEHSRADIHLECTAHRDGNHWVIEGQKSAWVANGTIATHALVLLCVDPSAGINGTALAIVPLDLPGVSRGKPLEKLGERALNQGEIFFDEVRIPEHYMVAGPEIFTMTAGATLARTAAWASAVSCGVARAAFEEAFRYAHERVQGGVPIAEHQLVQRRLFDMFAKLQAARALSRLAHGRLAGGLPGADKSLAAGLFCNRTAFELASDAVEIFGGMGLAKESVVEMLFRDARTSLIAHGTVDVLALAGFRQLRG